jgi:hypothetical protein
MHATSAYLSASRASSPRADSGTADADGSRTIGASVPSTSKRSAERWGSATKG